MFKIILILLSTYLISGCGAADKSDLELFVADVLASPRGRVEPIPEFKPYESFAYSASALRSPFMLPVVESEVLTDASNLDIRPNDNRTREYLEQFNIGDLSMVGTLQKPDGDLWALIRDGNGGVVRTRVGEYMGKNHGRIVSISGNHINLIEIVPAGDGGWLERPRTIALEGLSGEQL